MSESYKQLFDEQDLLEENQYQWVYTGIEKKAPHHKVLIHKFKKSQHFNEVFKELIDTLQNKCHIEETEEFILLVSKDLEGDNISLHLNFSNTSTDERLDYLYDYLHQAIAYIGFEPYLFNTLISSSQVVFVKDKLYLREKIVLDRRIDDEMEFTMVAKNMGQVMQRILITNYNELRTSIKYDHIYSFTESLIRREKEYMCFDDLFNDFKEIYFGKSIEKKHVLVGEYHPNNIFLDDIPEEKVESEIIKETPSLEVTDEERALLTGFSYKASTTDEDDFEEDLEEETEEEYIQTLAQREINDDGSFEESLDLSKLTDDNQSLEDLFVKKTQTVKITTPKKVEAIKTKSKGIKRFKAEKPIIAEVQAEIIEDKIEETAKRQKETITISNQSEADKFNNEQHKDDEPKFGVPAYMKEGKTTSSVPKRKKSKFAVHWSIPVIIILALLLISGAIYGAMKLLNQPESIALPPEAEFEAVFVGNTLKCTNLSTAFNGAYIHKSTWIIYKDDVKLEVREGAKKADFNVTGLTEGTYSIQLTVTDSEQISSKPYMVVKQYLSAESKALENKILSESTYAEEDKSQYESFDEFNISTSENISKTTEKFHAGQYAYTIDTSETHGIISFDGLDIVARSTLSFWIMKESNSPVEVQITGFKDGKSNFDKTLVAKSDELNKWKVVSIQLSVYDSTDTIILKFPEGQSIIWFDDLNITTHK